MNVMGLSLIAPDSSHWNKWIDGLHSDDAERRKAAHAQHERMLANGRVPVLAQYHVDEAISIANPEIARRRISDLRRLPLVATLTYPGSKRPGTLGDIIAAEAIAFNEGKTSAVEIRDRARGILMSFSEGNAIIAADPHYWDCYRRALMSASERADMAAAFSRPLKKSLGQNGFPLTGPAASSSRCVVANGMRC